MLEVIIGVVISYVFIASICFRIAIEIPHWEHSTTLRKIIEAEKSTLEDTEFVKRVSIDWFLAPFIMIWFLFQNWQEIEWDL